MLFLFKVDKKIYGLSFQNKESNHKNIYLFSGVNVVTHLLCLSKL